MTNKELIAEARTIAGRESTLTEGDIGDLLACLVNLADALEAVTVRPLVEGEPG